MDNQQKARTYIYGHESQETAYTVKDYPWGFSLRTEQRYWIESKKGQGQRFVTQTLNPKNGKWCAPKKSTYSKVIMMYLDENNHVKYTALGIYDKKETIEKWVEKHKENLTDFQKNQLISLLAYNNVMNHVTFTFQPVNNLGKSLEDIEKESEQRHKQNKENERIILGHIKAEYHRTTV